MIEDFDKVISFLILNSLLLLNWCMMVMYGINRVYTKTIKKCIQKKKEGILWNP